MSDEKNFISELRVWFLTGAAGILVFTCCLIGSAAWMAAQRCSGSVAGPLTAASAGVGSFSSGWLAAFCRQRQGLLCGIIQGGVFALLLTVLMLSSGGIPDRSCFVRIAVAILCGCFGGFSGVRVHHKKHYHA